MKDECLKSNCTDFYTFWEIYRKSDSDSEPTSPIRMQNKVEKTKDQGYHEKTGKLEKKVSIK